MSKVKDGSVNGVPVKAGVNLCEWNIGGKCTNPDLHFNAPYLVEGHSRAWDSPVNCTVTVYGVYHCHGYRYVDSANRPTHTHNKEELEMIKSLKLKCSCGAVSPGLNSLMERTSAPVLKGKLGAHFVLSGGKWFHCTNGGTLTAGTCCPGEVRRITEVNK